MTENENQAAAPPVAEPTPAASQPVIHPVDPPNEFWNNFFRGFNFNSLMLLLILGIAFSILIGMIILMSRPSREAAEVRAREKMYKQLQEQNDSLQLVLVDLEKKYAQDSLNTLIDSAATAKLISSYEKSKTTSDEIKIKHRAFRQSVVQLPASESVDLLDAKLEQKLAAKRAATELARHITDSIRRASK